jgi:hypothetical protein
MTPSSEVIAALLAFVCAGLAAGWFVAALSLAHPGRS